MDSKEVKAGKKKVREWYKVGKDKAAVWKKKWGFQKFCTRIFEQRLTVMRFNICKSKIKYSMILRERKVGSKSINPKL